MEEADVLAHLGPPRALADLTVPRALQLGELLEQCDELGAHPDGYRVTDSADWLLVQIDVDVGSITKVDIRRRESFAIMFGRADQNWPRALALRSDFPRDLIHLNVVASTEPVSLCLSEEPWAEARRRWTPAAFIALIRRWLLDAAEGRLHRDEQVVEPFLPVASSHAILPSNCFTERKHGSLLTGSLAPGSQEAGQPVYIFDYDRQDPSAPEFFAVLLGSAPRVHGIVHRAPRNLEELVSLFGEEDSDFPALFDTMLKAQLDQSRLLNTHFLVLVQASMMRHAEGPIERTDLWGFLVEATLREVGIAFDLWAEGGGGSGPKLFNRLPGPFGGAIGVEQVNILPDLNAKAAAMYNGREPSGRKIVVVGAGALGSQVMANLARAGEEPTAVIDKDRLLPHNLARHAVWDRRMNGWSKVEAIAMMDRQLRERNSAMSCILADAASVSTDPEAPIEKALAAADVVLDLAASVSVSRRLAGTSSLGGRRISLFLSPNGADLVMLREDADRTIPLDHLEMNYYAAVAARSELDGHMALPGTIRYARSCREQSSQLPQTSIALHAAIGTDQVTRAFDAADAAAIVWRLDPETMTVGRVTLDSRPMVSFVVGEWTVLVAASLVDGLMELRAAALPRETGGVLLGDFDLDRKRIYVVHYLPPPVDSIEEPSGFVRGAQGLSTAIQKVTDKTQGMLRYVGEWHSHPPGVPPTPSVEDANLYAHLAGGMNLEGFPPIMLIAGDRKLGAVIGDSSPPLAHTVGMSDSMAESGNDGAVA